jgi:uncharacterized protein YjbI with pentapeptide repeats
VFVLDREEQMPNNATVAKLVVMDHLAIAKNELHQLLRDGKMTEFNSKKANLKEVDLRDCNLRGLDLRGMDTKGVDFSGSYLRQADLRGLDLRPSIMEGTSIHHCVISGVYFPKELSAQEIALSHELGVRMRYLRK